MNLTEEYQDNNKQTLLENFLFPVNQYNKNKLEEVVSQKTILITGATYGIGALVAERLSEFNVTLLLVARTEERLIDFQEKCKGKTCKIFIYSTDLRNENEINELIKKIEASEIDIFINNAGKSITRSLANSLDRFQDTQRCCATNYTGPVKLLLGILPGIIKNKGQVINISALNVLLPPTAGWSAYQSSKAAIDQWLKCIEPELHIAGVAVSHIYLPLVRTRMSMINEKNHKRPAMSKSKAASVILKSIITKKRKHRPWWTGFVLFWCSLLPNLWYKLQIHHLKNKQK